MSENGEKCNFVTNICHSVTFLKQKCHRLEALIYKGLRAFLPHFVTFFKNFCQELYIKKCDFLKSLENVFVTHICHTRKIKRKEDRMHA